MRGVNRMVLPSRQAMESDLCTLCQALHLPLVEDGKANVEIVIMTRVPAVRFAAEELQRSIVKATGVTVNIVDRRSGTIPAIPEALCIAQYLTGIEPGTRYLLTSLIKLKDVE